MRALRLVPKINNKAVFTAMPITGGPLYRPQTLNQTNRILLPPRFNTALVLLILLVTSAVAFVFAQSQPSSNTQYAPPPSPIARAEAAPVVIPAIDPRLDEVAALMPAETAERLPSTPKLKADVKAHPVSLSLKPRPKSNPTRAPSQLEILTAQGIAYGRQGDYQAADQVLRAALALDHGNPAILYNLGVSAERQGDSDSARTLYEAALLRGAERPDNPLQPGLVMARLDALDARDSQ